MMMMLKMAMMMMMLWRNYYPTILDGVVVVVEEDADDDGYNVGELLLVLPLFDSLFDALLPLLLQPTHVVGVGFCR